MQSRGGVIRLWKIQTPSGDFARSRIWTLVGATILAISVGAVVGRLTAAPPPKPPTSVTIVRPTPAVVTALRDLNRLESAECHVERVIDLKDKQTRFFGLVSAEDAILLVAAGDAVAGVDLSKLKDGDVVVDSEKKKAVIHLPKPEILSARVDNDKTYVHARTTDTLAKRKENLESEARKEAEKSIVEAAKESGVLARAEKNAQRTVETLVRSLGYSEVTVDFR
jgi:hypothetical protein